MISSVTFYWLCILLILLIVYAVKSYLKVSRYWFDRGVPTAYYFPFFGDNWKVVFGLKSAPETQLSTYFTFKDAPYYGCIQFGNPALTVRDPEIIKKILLKNADHFTDHNGNIFNHEVDPLFSRNLFSLRGKAWKDMRSTISPVFTSSKMKMMFHLVNECAEAMIKNCEAKLTTEKSQQYVDLEMKEIFSHFTNNVVAVTAFGMQVDSVKDSKNIFYQMSDNFTNFSGTRFVLTLLAKPLMLFLGEGLIPKYVNSFFSDLITNAIKYREEKNIIRPDLLHLLIEAKKGKLMNDDTVDEPDNQFAVVEDVIPLAKADSKDKRMELTDDDITAQAMVFVLAGTETSSIILSFTCYELALNPSIQDHLRKEIDETRKNCVNGQIAYETLNQMKYLDMVISETLRKYPPVPGSERTCTTEYLLETDTHSFTIEKNTSVNIPIHAMHHDPTFYPDPEKYDPERFSVENRKKIIPYSYLPFSTGPRACIGSRFALMEMKIILFHLLSRFVIEPNKNTQIPIKFKRAPISLTYAENGISLRFVSRKEHMI